jgi:hypothetical protein
MITVSDCKIRNGMIVYNGLQVLHQDSNLLPDANFILIDHYLRQFSSQLNTVTAQIIYFPIWGQREAKYILNTTLFDSQSNIFTENITAMKFKAASTNIGQGQRQIHTLEDFVRWLDILRKILK